MYRHYNIVSKNRLIYQDEELSVLYGEGSVFIQNRFTRTLHKVELRRTFFLSPIIERMLRREVKVAERIEKNIFFSYNGVVYKINTEEFCVEVDHKYRKGMNNPLYFTHIKGIPGFQESLAYGEYWGNRNCEPVCVYVRDKKKWRVAYQFGKETIRHIHNLIPDAENGRVLILTGDEDPESGIWEAREDFNIVRPLLTGKQGYRSCIAFPTNGGILYATDSPLEPNYIYFFDEIREKLIQIKHIMGPCIYGRRYFYKGTVYYLFATSVEPDSRIRGKRYLLTTKRGSGVETQYTEVWAGNMDKGFQRIFSLRKDILPMGLFQFGNILFCNSDDLYVVPQSVKKYHGHTIQLDISEIV